MIVWSLTKWRDYESCPRMFHAKHCTKDWQDTPSPAIARGRDAHKAFEQAVKFELPLPPEFASFETVIEHFSGRDDVMTEYKLGLDTQLAKCGFFDSNVFIRVVFDLFIPRKKALIVDYKTGKARDEHRSDAEFYGACAGTAYKFDEIHVQYWYLDNPPKSFSLPVEDPPGVMARWKQLFNAAQANLDAGKIPAMEGPQCRWCQVTSCEHFRGRK